MTTINEAQDELTTILTAALVGPGLPLNAVYGYRTTPMLAKAYMAITYISGWPQPFVATGEQPFYDFALSIVVKHDNDAATLASAEQTLNETESIIYTTLEKHRNNLWRKVVYPEPSIRPPAPDDMPRIRYGEVYVRTYVK